MKKMLFLMVMACLATSANAAGDAKAFCPNGVKSQYKLSKKVVKDVKEPDGSTSELTSVTTVDPTGNCYRVDDADFVYLIDRHRAIYKVLGEDYFSNILVMVNFGKSKANVSGFSGVVKGIGRWQYKDERGLPHKIPAVALMPAK